MNPTVLEAWCEVLTLTWLHSLWQGAVLGVAVALVLAVLGRASAALHYAVALLGLAVFAIGVLATGILMAQRMEPVTEGQVVMPEPAEEVFEQAPLPKMTPGPVVVPLETPAPHLISPILERAEPTGTSPDLWRWVRSQALAWAPWIAGLWLVGVFLLGLRFGAAWFGVRRLRCEGLHPVSRAIQAQLEGLSRKLGVRATVRVVESSLTLTPIILGWAKPLILLPAGMACGLSGQQLEAILLHELAHIRRHDFLTNMMQRVIETLLFYHPVVWWLSRRVRLERECCCDDLAAKACGDRVGYASVLTLVEEFRQSTDLALSVGGKPLATRIHRLLQPAPRRPLPAGAFVSLLGAGLVALLAWWPSSTTTPGLQAAEGVSGASADVSLYVVAGAPEEESLWQIDFREGREIGRERVLTLQEFDEGRLYQNRYAISEEGAVIDLEQRRVLRSPKGTFMDLIDGQVYCATDSQLTAFDLKTLIERPVLPIERVGKLSPNGEWSLNEMHGTGSPPKLVRLADELTINCPVLPEYYGNPLSSTFMGAAMLWLDNETVLIGATNTDWITMNVYGEVEEIVTIPALDWTRLYQDPNLRLWPHRLFKDPLGTIVYESKRAFAIDVEAKQWRPYDWHQLGHGFSVKPEWYPEASEFRLQGKSIGHQSAWQRMAIADYLVAAGDLDEVSYWSTHTGVWADVEIERARVIGWVDHRSPARSGPLVVRDWGTYVLSEGDGDRRHSIHVYGGDEGMTLNLGVGSESWERTLHEKASAVMKDTGTALRDVSAKYLRTGDHEERFLSYQAPKRGAPPTKVSMNEEGLQLSFPEIHPEGVEPINVLAIINEGGRYRVALEWMFGVQSECFLAKDQFREVDRDEVLALARQLWRYTGATHAEANALVKSCQAELLGAGALCVYPMTKKQMEVDLPLSVEPEPNEIHRRVVILEKLSP